MCQDDDIRNREAWNACHRAQHEGALSGSDAEEVLRHHRIADMIRPGLVVLDIGVGLGGMSRYLHSRGCIVDALDVADVAEKTVRAYVSRFYVAADIETLTANTYDLAISMIVAQHMCERNLREQIKHVGRALKPGGLFSLHLAGATEGPLNNLPGPIPSGMDGAMCRDPEYALAMIADVLGTGYTASVLEHRMHWPKFKSYWYWVRILKGKAEDNG